MDRRSLRVLLRHKSAILGLAVLVLMVLLSACIGLTSYDPTSMNEREMLQKPGGGHPLGTDDLGRDVFARLWYGGRISLSIGLGSVLFSMLIGIPLGAISGYFGGWVDFVISRIIDVMLGLPSILLAILVASAMGKGVKPLIIAVGIVGIPQFARQVRASVLSLKEQDFVQASRALGASGWRIVAHEIMPNAMGPIIVLATLGVGSAILTAAGLSFLGLGVETGTAEWGAMLHDGRRVVSKSAHLAIFSGLAITLAVLAINLFGDGLRDALDPKGEKKAF